MKSFILTSVFFILSLSLSAQLTSFVGVGVRLQIDSTSGLGFKAAKVIAFVPGGSAEFSGLKIGDYIIKVDDKSATNMTIDQVVNLIKGEPESMVKFDVKQSGTMKVFKMKRRKFETSSFYVTPAVSSEFGNNLARLINDAPFDFKYVIDSTSHREENSGFARNVFPCKVSLPNVKEVTVVRSFGTTCNITVGVYNTMDEVNKNGEKFIDELKKVFPKAYYFSKKGTESNTIQIGNQSDQGHTRAFMVMYSYQDKTTKQYKLELRIESGVPNVYYKIASEKAETDFANGLHKVYNDVMNNFENLKGTEHKSDDIFNASYWYDVNFSIPNSGKSYVDAGSLMEIRADEYRSLFYSGDSKEDAAASYTKLSELILKGFGKDFVYTYDKPDEFFAQIIPDNSEKYIIFLNKKERSIESLPLSVLVFQKAENGKYIVYLTFYKSML